MPTTTASGVVINGQLLCWSTMAEIDSRGLPIPPKDVLSIEGRKDAQMWYGCAEKEWEGLDDKNLLNLFSQHHQDSSEDRTSI